MSTIQNTTKRCAKTTVPAAISPVLDTYTGDAALEALLRADKRLAIMPQAGRLDLLADLLDIVKTAEFFGLSSVRQLITEQNRILTSLTGTAVITQFHAPQVADRLHTYRNLMLTLAVAAVTDFRGDPTGLYQDMVKLRPRTGDIRRPLTDDEILLARFAARSMSLLDPLSERAAVYSMVDAGMVPGETTSVTLDDVDDYEMPQMIDAVGNGHLQARFIPLDPFAANIIGRFTNTADRQGTPVTKTLTYSPRTSSAKYNPVKHAPGKPAATAAAQGLIDRMFKEIGIFNIDITATSPRLWRLVETYRTSDVATAQALAGYGDNPKDVDRLWHVLGQFEKLARCTSDDSEISFL